MPPKQKKQKAQVASGKGPQDASNMERLYFQLYDTNIQKYGPQTGILLQVGRFFEIYDYVETATGQARTNVQTLAELCGCVVEQKQSADPAYGRLFWGFPETSLPKFERLLVAAGYTVVVHVQEKNTSGDVVNRPLDHVSSPGTYYDGDGGLAIRKEEQCMVGLYVEPWTDERKGLKYWSVSTTAFDVMTGNCISTEADIQLIDGKPVFDSMTPFWALHPPAEVVFCWSSAEPVPKNEEIATFVSPSTRIPPIHTIILDPKTETSVLTDRLRINFLEQVYKPAVAISVQEFLGISSYPMIRRSLFNILHFIEEHNKSYISALYNHSVWQPEQNVLLGNSALQQLAMLPLNSDKPQESLLYWLQKAQTSMGRQTLRERLLKPIADIEELEARQKRIAALRESSSNLTASLKGMYDLPRIYRRFQLRNGTTQDLLQLTTTYEKAAQVLQAIANTMYDVQDADVLPHVQEFLSNFSTGRIRTAHVTTHPWNRGIYPELDAYEDSWTALEASMTTLRTSWNELLKEEDAIQWTVREDGPFTFTTTQRRATCVVNGMKVRGQTVTATKYGAAKNVLLLETAEVVQANATAIKLRQNWSAAIAETWSAFWDAWINKGIKSSVLQRLAHTIGTVDAEHTLAQLSQAYGYVRPTYQESSDAVPAGVHVHELRHPIIERINANTPYIPHTMSFGLDVEADAKSSNGILLYGVNAAGKSSLGKALGLAVLMAQTGMPVPASAMTLVPYTALFTRILGNDNLWAGMSSFVVEMTEFRSILRAAGPRTLVIGDELCAGTETASATSIVAAGIQRLTEKNAQFLFATHLHELVDVVKDQRIAAYHLTVHSDPSKQSLVYDRKLKPGCGSPMYGLEVCRGLDMDAEFLELAFKYRKQHFGDKDAHASVYNAAVIVDKCAICGSKDRLETHHIVQQADAKEDGKITAGTDKDHPSNLVPLCDKCHTKHHKGKLHIKGWFATSTGRNLLYTLTR
jgi:DNA mismatch repair protein MutS